MTTARFDIVPSVLIQLVVVALVMPSFMVLSRTPAYTALRLALAGLGLARDGVWLAERTTLIPSTRWSPLPRRSWPIPSSSSRSSLSPRPRPGASPAAVDGVRSGERPDALTEPSARPRPLSSPAGSARTPGVRGDV